MARDAGTRAIHAKQRRQRVTLTFLIVSLVLASYVRFVHNGPGGATAEDLDPAGRVLGTGNEPQPDRPQAPVVEPVPVTWAVRIEHDPFAWEPNLPQVETAPADADAQAVRREAAEKLEVNAVLLGDPPRAMINGRVYNRGEEVNGFRVSQIDRAFVVVEKYGTAVKLYH